MKPRLCFRNGYWWCRRMGVVGQGRTPAEAWNDMWNLYREAVTFYATQTVTANPRSD